MPSLSKSFCIEVVGGNARTVIERGSEIPITRINFFSTVDDSQHVIEIRVLRGDAGAGINDSYAKYLIHRVPEAPKGKASVAVRFEVDSQENLKLTAFDQHTGNELPVTPR